MDKDQQPLTQGASPRSLQPPASTSWKTLLCGPLVLYGCMRGCHLSWSGSGGSTVKRKEPCGCINTNAKQPACRLGWSRNKQQPVFSRASPSGNHFFPSQGHNVIQTFRPPSGLFEGQELSMKHSYFCHCGQNCFIGWQDKSYTGHRNSCCIYDLCAHMWSPVVDILANVGE